MLDGRKVHKKYLALKRIKTEILVKQKMDEEAIAEMNSYMAMVAELSPDNDKNASDFVEA